MCLTLPPDAHADFATLYVICAHCNLLSVRIERVFRRPAMIRNQFRHSIYPGISKRIAWQKKRRMWKIAESRNERTKIPRRIEILCRDYRNIITRKIRFEEEGKGKRTLRNNSGTTIQSPAPPPFAPCFRSKATHASKRSKETPLPTSRQNSMNPRTFVPRTSIITHLAPRFARVSNANTLARANFTSISTTGEITTDPFKQSTCMQDLYRAEEKEKRNERRSVIETSDFERLYNFPRSLVHPGHGRSSDRTSRPLNGHLKQFDSTTSSIELPQTSSKPNRTNSFAVISINIDFKFVGETHVKLRLLERRDH